MKTTALKKTAKTAKKVSQASTTKKKVGRKPSAKTKLALLEPVDQKEEYWNGRIFRPVTVLGESLRESEDPFFDSKMLRDFIKEKGFTEVDKHLSKHPAPTYRLAERTYSHKTFAKYTKELKIGDVFLTVIDKPDILHQNIVSFYFSVKIPGTSHMVYIPSSELRTWRGLKTRDYYNLFFTEFFSQISVKASEGIHVKHENTLSRILLMKNTPIDVNSDKTKALIEKCFLLRTPKALNGTSVGKARFPSLALPLSAKEQPNNLFDLYLAVSKVMLESAYWDKVQVTFDQADGKVVHRRAESYDLKKLDALRLIDLKQSIYQIFSGSN